MPRRVHEVTEMTVLANKVDELVSGNAEAGLSALLTVLAWKVVDVAEMIEKPADEVIEQLAEELKDAARQIVAAQDEHEQQEQLQWKGLVQGKDKDSTSSQIPNQSRLGKDNLKTTEEHQLRSRIQNATLIHKEEQFRWTKIKDLI